MRFRFFSIPAHGADDLADELNGFLAGTRVLGVDRQFVNDGQGGFWAICVSHIDGGQRPPAAKRGKVDSRMC